MRARAEESRAAGDASAIARTCAALARRLASRDRDLDTAVSLGTCALQAKEDIELRRDVSSWLESLGDPGLAADMLAPIAGISEKETGEAAYVLVRIGVLKARAGDGVAAAEAFETALALELDGPMVAELRAVGAGALRSDNFEAAEKLARVTRAGDVAALGDALAWVLSQPLPPSQIVGPFVRALRAMADKDASRAVVVARRALDVYGPRLADLRNAMLEIAANVCDDGFATAILERSIACGIDGDERRDLFFRLADSYERLGDEAGEARVVARALDAGHAGADAERHLERLGGLRSLPDTEIWLLRALAIRSAAGTDQAAAARAFRDLGAALWDLADDRAGALDAWRKAARKAPRRGYTTLTLDLVAFGGAPFAFEYLTKVVENEPEPIVAAEIAADVARAALSLDFPRAALDIAGRGIARSALCGVALEMAERAVEQAGEAATLSTLYDLVATHALGRFGRRATHHRGARFFERGGEHALALRHAAQAFRAVPSAGSSLHLLARAAVRAGDPVCAVDTIEQVAERDEQSASRDFWLLRAASLTGSDEEGLRRKIDILLRVADATPSAATILLLRDAARNLIHLVPKEREALQTRLSSLYSTIVDRLRGTAGASAAIALALLSLELFADSERAFLSLEHAFACDANAHDYAKLIDHAAILAGAPDARARLTAIVSAAEGPVANAGTPLLRLLARIGSALGDPVSRARASVAAAALEPENDVLIVEADAAVRASPDLGGQLSGQISMARRTQAILSVARGHLSDGHHAQAADLFERATAMVEGERLEEVERELRAAWDAAGRVSETDARVQSEAAGDGATPSTRADRWTEIAERREIRGDKAGAVRALIEACKLDPEPLERWSALERRGEAAGEDEALIMALEQMAQRVGEEGRAAVLKRLARAYERHADFEAAIATWHQVLSADPDAQEADRAIESLIVGRGQYGRLAEHLARRATHLSGLPEMGETVRAVRLRRAAILEQHLGRIDEACRELATLLSEWPENSTALRYMADLLDRQGRHAEAADCWQRAATVEADIDERDALELRAASASQLAGDTAAALEHVRRVLAHRPSHHAALGLRADIARATGLDGVLGDALASIAASDGVDDRTRVDLLLEAAQAAARAGDAMGALERAQQAAVTAHGRATPQLLARGLEYRLRRAGTLEDAHRTIEDLAHIREPLGPDDKALRAFLLAEALDVAGSRVEALRELEETRASGGDHALVALGLAERLATQTKYAEAVEMYRVALGGSLLELRKPGNVAMQAADVAIRAGLVADAITFLDEAERHEEGKAAIESYRALLAEPKARSTTSARAPVDDAVIYAMTSPTPRPGELRKAAAAAHLADLETALRCATTPRGRAYARLALGKEWLELGDSAGAEPLLWEALSDGLPQAGEVLLSLLAGAPERTHDIVRVRWQQVALEPGNAGRLESLRAAAIADQDHAYADAVEHVLRAFDPAADPLPAPPLNLQPEHPGILALLVRPSGGSTGEALALLWEGATQLFARAAASYGITGLERVVPGASSAIARVYEMAMRVLDAPRIPLFVRRSNPGTPAAGVALLVPPSVILTGDVREDTSAMRFALGRGMSAALPQNALRLGLPATEGRALLDAARAAFGPPELGRRVETEAARLAESLWEVVPARAQRRLQELLSTLPFSDYDELVSLAHQSGRRAGMFLSGDFAYSARVLLSESAEPPGEDLSLATLQSYCDRIPELADLLRLAVSPEYAEARWHSPAAVSPRLAQASRRFSLF